MRRSGRERTMLPPTRILVAIDMSDDSAALLTYAARLSHTFGAALNVLHVVHPLLASAGAASGVQLQADAMSALELFGAAAPRVPSSTRYHVTIGLTSDAVMHVADRERADLIVTG